LPTRARSVISSLLPMDSKTGAMGPNVVVPAGATVGPP
jgi:hypothetical protein